MADPKTHNFERARNTARFKWAGDPDQWGGRATFSANGPPSTPVDTYGTQVLRAQTEDLVSLAWDLVATWSVDGLVAGDVGFLALEMTVGTGQATSLLYLLLASIENGALVGQNAGAKLLGFEASPNGALPYSGVDAIVANGGSTLTP